MSDNNNALCPIAAPAPVISAWHHSPMHAYTPGCAYMITASTLQKHPYYHDDTRLSLLQETLLTAFAAYDWRPQAWAVFPNHYHCVALSPAPGQGKALKTLMQRVHSQASRLLNTLDQTPGRRIWFQYWDTMLTYEKSYYARLNYTHNNAVKHGVAAQASRYPYCSATWFEQNAPRALYLKISAFKWDAVNVMDDYEVTFSHAPEKKEER